MPRAIWSVKGFMLGPASPMPRSAPWPRPELRPRWDFGRHLEPCHHGRTPPCGEAVIAAGVTRVVVALEDPDPRVAGGGIAQLRAAGLEVITGVLRAEAMHQNRAFLHRVRTGRPWGVLKWAMGLDGRTALANGASQWITGVPARRWVHRLRRGCDAVVVGVARSVLMIRCSPAVAEDAKNRYGWC